MIYLKLFWAFFQVGLFAFGGGYAALPLIEEQVVQNNAWLHPETFADLITISQMTPGPIAINAASFVGIQVAGLPGAIVATVANVTPCILIVLLLSKLYAKYSELPLMQHVLQGLRPAVIALIASAAWSLTRGALASQEGLLAWSGINLFSLAIFMLSLLAYHKLKKLDPVLIMLVMGGIGGIAFYVFKF
ncbi:MAG: chromate transporter [Eubacteriales bacterium]|nr:chromate transporter [Eubacteriales bacterium]